jgi:hypothetical protein
MEQKMYRERSEIVSFSKDDLERFVRYMAQQQIMGNLFIGKFNEQMIQWRNDGGVDVITKYVQGGWEDLPKMPVEEQLALPKKSKKGK